MLTRQPLGVEYALLGLLSAAPRHGYELYGQLTDPAGLWLVWRIKQSQLYALLGRLEAEGLVASTVEPQASRPPRKIYALTETGRSAFLGWVHTPVEHPRQMRLEFLAKLYFAQRVGPATVRRLLAQQRTMCRTWLTTQQALAGASEHPATFAGTVTAFRIGQIEGLLDWLTTCEQDAFLANPNEP